MSSRKSMSASSGTGKASPVHMVPKNLGPVQPLGASLQGALGLCLHISPERWILPQAPEDEQCLRAQHPSYSAKTISGVNRVDRIYWSCWRSQQSLWGHTIAPSHPSDFMANSSSRTSQLISLECKIHTKSTHENSQKEASQSWQELFGLAGI